MNKKVQTGCIWLIVFSQVILTKALEEDVSVIYIVNYKVYGGEVIGFIR